MKYLITLLILLSSSLAAFGEGNDVIGVLTDPKSYLSQKVSANMKLSYEDVERNPMAYEGQVFEVVGEFKGTCHGSSDSVVFSVSDSSSVILDYDAYTLPEGEFNCLVKVEKPDETSPDGTVVITVNPSYKIIAATPTVSLERYIEQIRLDKAEAERLARSSLFSLRGAAVEMPPADENTVALYTKRIKGYNSSLSDGTAANIARAVVGYGTKYRVHPDFICAFILAESKFNPTATSRVGASGLGQLMPRTAASMGITNIYDPVQNVYGSARYIRSMLDRTGGPRDWENVTEADLRRALAAYNAGIGNYKKYGGNIPFKETRRYVERVMGVYRKTAGLQ